MDKEQAKSKLLEFINLIPAFVKLMYQLAKDQRVSLSDKAVLGAAIAYVFSPIDLIPDFIPFLGQIDDAYIVAIALQRLINSAGPEVLKEHWEGDMAVFNSLQNAIEAALFFLPQKTVDTLLKKIPS
jgi:uncharacterized membrane protein YkvA (DUF1232 family)